MDQLVKELAGSFSLSTMIHKVEREPELTPNKLSSPSMHRGTCALLHIV